MDSEKFFDFECPIMYDKSGARAMLMQVISMQEGEKLLESEKEGRYMYSILSA